MSPRRDPDRLYTLPEVASRLRVSLTTVKRKVASGELRTIAVAGTERKTRRVSEAELAAYLAAASRRGVA